MGSKGWDAALEDSEPKHLHGIHSVWDSSALPRNRHQDEIHRSSRRWKQGTTGASDYCRSDPGRMDQTGQEDWTKRLSDGRTNLERVGVRHTELKSKMWGDTVDLRVYSGFLGMSGFPNECGEERGRMWDSRACIGDQTAQFPTSLGVPVLNAGPFVGSRRKSDHRMKNAS